MRSAVISKFRRGRDLARFFYNQRIIGFDVPDEPYFDLDSSDTFRALLAQTKYYLEFGSGGSTVAAARANISTITVESDPYFAAAVKEKIGADAPNTMLVVNIGTTTEWGYPLFTRKTKKRVQHWASYVCKPLNQIDQLSKGFPDLILIDGRFRRACALASAERAIRNCATTTICFDDYAGRAWYHDVERYLPRPEMIGRMAIFRISPSDKSPPDHVIREALADYR